MKAITHHVSKVFGFSDAEAKLKALKEQAAFVDFNDSVTGFANTTFSPMYARVFKKYWDNEFYARMHHSYFYSNFNFGLFEFYIPTFESLDNNMKYSRIAIKIVPELDDEIYAKAIEELRTKHVSDPRTLNKGGPAGLIDSESLFVVARKLGPKALEKWREDRDRSKKGLKKKMDWFLKAKRLTLPEVVPNIRVFPIITKVPEIVLKRLLTILIKFYEKRLKAFYESFNLDSLSSDYSESSLVYSISHILESKGLGFLSNAILCLNHSLNWLRQKRTQIIAEMARQTNINRTLAKISEIKPILRQITNAKNPFILEPDSPLMETLIQLVNLKPNSRPRG